MAATRATAGDGDRAPRPPRPGRRRTVPFGTRSSRRALGVAVALAAAIAVGPAAPGAATTCRGTTTAAVAQAAPVPFCETGTYQVAKTQDGTIYRTADDYLGVSQQLALDVYEPVGDPPAQQRPALLWMHGGYFAFGDRTQNQPTIDDFASRGFVVISIDYRMEPLPPAVGGLSIPTPRAVQNTLEDAVAAVQWIHANAAALRIDPASVVAAGYSAGAITALGLAHKPTAVSAAGSPTPIAAAVSYSGMDLYPADPLPTSAVPVLMYNGESDTIVPLAAASSGCHAINLAGPECDQLAVPGGHSAGTAERYQQTVAWLADHGITELAACDRFDTVSGTITTTTAVGHDTATTTTTAPTSVGGTGAAPAAPVAATPSYTG